MINFEALLKKYMTLVRWEEEATFTNWLPPEVFSSEEQAWLETLADTIEVEYHKRLQRGIQK